jgi:hypothetical protein
VVDHECGAVKGIWNRVPIHKLLHDDENNPLLRELQEGKIRHVHLPANNMKWVEVSICAGS